MKTKKKLKFLNQIVELALDRGLDVKIEALDTTHTKCTGLCFKDSTTIVDHGLVLYVSKREGAVE